MKRKQPVAKKKQNTLLMDVDLAKYPGIKVVTPKMASWLYNFLNQDNPTTFLNKTQSAMYAGYRGTDYHAYGQVGWENYKKLEPFIKEWLNNYGMSEEALKQKCISLMNAKSTQVVKVNGEIDYNSLDKNCKVLATTKQTKTTQTGFQYEEEHSVIAIEQEDLSIQSRALGLAVDIQGLKAPTKIEQEITTHNENEVDLSELSNEQLAGLQQLLNQEIECRQAQR